MMETKVCISCKTELPATLEYFYRSQYKRDGLYGHCKECHRIRNEKVHQLRKDIVKPKVDHDASPDLKPEYKRYSVGKLDIVLCSSRGKLYKTVDYKTWRKRNPFKKIQMIDI